MVQTEAHLTFSVLTHEAFQYLTMIRRTKVVNGVLIETYEDPSDDESEEDESEDDESGREDALPFTEEGERERLLCVGGKKVVKRAGKKAEVGNIVTPVVFHSIVFKTFCFAL